MRTAVRHATSADLPGILEIERACETAPHWTEAEYASILKGSGVPRCFLVGERDGRLVGFAVAKAAAGEGELESIAVDPGARRLGVGLALCEQVLAWCRQAGAESVDLEVRSGSTGAIRLYYRLGFCRVGIRRGYYHSPDEDACLMRLSFKGQTRHIGKP